MHQFKINSHNTVLMLIHFSAEIKLIFYPRVSLVSKIHNPPDSTPDIRLNLDNNKKNRFVCSHTYLKMIFWHTYPFSVLYGEFERKTGINLTFSDRLLTLVKYKGNLYWKRKNVFITKENLILHFSLIDERMNHLD